ncbi:uncharacterized transmembrane protein DDB_G0289901-like [Colletes gigas]|uniref:uncharacterized transmembrane protein DDB_G0289901-like n=1 Tax=Colletes gigas TaxID=935657 RepID=UPI001C9B4A52|nr:uncharacterized transmembrane protein DDB_G0289901-like [Colletes gigas]
MRLILIILILSSGTGLPRYYEKRRFDRSVYDDFETHIMNIHLPKKQWTFIDHETHFKAYKDKKENDCYLENLEDSVGLEELSENRFQQRKQASRVLYASTEALTKLEAWRIAGGRVVDFCQGRQIILLQSTMPIVIQTVDPFSNVIPQDENDIVTRRVTDVVLTPLISRAKRQIMLEERQKLNEKFRETRIRRQAQQQPRGKFRGQTQSQYLNIGNNDQSEGKAEAEATQQSSRALVSGSRGMGQAQSMSSSGIGCEDCPKYTSEAVPDRYIQHPGTTGTATGGTHFPNVFPTIGQSGGRIVHPGTRVDATYPGGVTPGEKVYPDTITPGGGVVYHGNVPGGTRTGGGEVYPGGVPGARTTGGGVAYPGNVPGSTTTGGGTVYPGNVPGGTTTGGGTVYPGNVPGGTTTGGGTVYPGNVPGGTTTGGGTVYPGNVPGGTTTGGGTVYPGNVPGGTTTGGGTVYPGSVPGTRTTGGGVTYPGNVPGGTTTGGGTVYPGSVPGSRTTGGGVTYPGNVPHGTTTGGIVYPGPVPGSTTIGGGTVYPGNVPGSTTIGGGTVYPGNVPGSTATGDGTIYPGNIPGLRTTDGGVAYPGSIPGVRTTDGGVAYPGSIPGVRTTDGGVAYPGSVPSVRTTDGGVAYPGSIPGVRTTDGGVAYPGSVPGSQTPGGGVVYPTNVHGSTITRNGVVYPGGAPGTTTGGGVVYPGGAPGTTRGGVVYPGGAPGTTTGGSVVYPGGVPGTTAGGGVVYPGGAPGTTGGGVVYPGGAPGTTGGGVVYPGGAPGTTTGGGVVYPGGVPGTRTTGGGIAYPVNVPGSTAPGGGAIYPSRGSEDTITTSKFGPYPGLVPDSDRTYLGNTGDRGATRGQVITESNASADSRIYPGQIPGVLYPGMVGTGPSVNGNVGRTTTTGADGGIAYPGGVSPSDRQLISTGGDSTSGTRTITPGGVGTYPGTGDRINYPGGISTGTGGTGLYPGGVLPGINQPSVDRGTIYPYPESTQVRQGGYPPGVQVGSDNTHLQNIGNGGSGILYPNTVLKYPGGPMTQYPGAEKYPSTYPSGYPPQGQYPGATTWNTGQGQTIPDITGGRVSEEINRQGAERYPSPEQNVRQQYLGVRYPNEMGPAGNTREISQYYQQAGSFPSTGDDNSDSQASSSVKQTDSGTQASASAQGTQGQGTAQSQVTGTYSGSGSFAAQAGSSDVNKSAQTEISGDQNGATSNSQGTGGYGKSQAQVQLDSESGATLTDAQSSGWNHGTNSQVQASTRGGMADAQANGEGSTSSQAQIGFQPYLKTDEKLERHSRPFRGGGTASAQSGTNRGQSQSQLEGSFQYGITYTGAAQAGSGSGAVASRKPFNFNRTDTELFHPFKPYNIPQIGKNNKSETTNLSSDADYEYNQSKLPQGLQTSSSSHKIITSNVTGEQSQNGANNQNQSSEKSHVDDTMYEYDEEYDGDDYDTSQMQTSMTSKQSKSYIAEQNNSDHQSQIIQFTTGNRYDVRVNQDSNTAQPGDTLQLGQSLPGYTIPPGFRGRVTSIAGDETIAHGDGKSQSQTVSLTPIEPNITRENKSPITEVRSLETAHEKLAKDHTLFRDKHQRHGFPRIKNQLTSMEYSKPTTNVPIKSSYYTVTNSFAGKMDGSKNSPRKYEHRYYTKSSTCGYFTFSCNVVYGSNGRTKICKPKMPTHPDGTPVKC